MISSKELVNAAFTFNNLPESESGGKVPAGVCLGGSWPFFIEGVSLKDLLNNPKRAAEIFYKVNERVDADFVTVGTGATAFLLEGLGAKIEFSKNGAPQIVSLLVNSKEDIDALDIPSAFKSERVLWLKEVAKETVRLNQNRRSIFISGRAPFTLAGQIMGLENFSKALYKNKELAERLLEFTTELSASYFEFMLETEGIDGIFLADPSASGDVVSKKHFAAVVIPYLTTVLKRLRPYGKLSLVHICGNITDRLDLLPETGMNMISVDSKVDLRKAKEILNGRIALAGNVNPCISIEDKSADGVYEDARQCIIDAADGGGFMLLPGCDISAKASEENVAALTRAAHNGV